MTPEKIQQLENENYQLKRDLSVQKQTVQGLHDQLSEALHTGLQQIQAVHAVACGIYGMTRLSRGYILRKVAASRVLQREYQGPVAALEALLGELDKKDAAALDAAKATAKYQVQACKKSIEQEKLELTEAALLACFQETEELLDLCKKEIKC